MRFETTIQRPCAVSGVGLHSGAPVNMRITPAPAGTGIVFRRSDLEFFPVAASWKHVARVSYATSLMRQGVLISTTEHLLSTLYSFGIDNAFVELDNLEVPIVDGSGKPFVDLLRTSGVREMKRQRKYLKIRKTVTVEDGKKRISILPDDVFRLTCEIDFPEPIGKQSLEMEVTPERYAKELAPARTFGFEHELAQMRERIRSMRRQFVELTATRAPAHDLSFIMKQRGMFSYSGLTRAQVIRLRDEFAIYAIESGRICVAALNSQNIGYVCDAVAKILG